MRPFLIILSSLAGIMGTLLYMLSIVKGKTKPHRMTRFIVFCILTLNFFSILASNGNFGAKLFAGITFGNGIILFAMSMWRGLGGSSKIDYACLVIAAIGVIGWQVTGIALVGVWFAILADVAAYIPAFIKTWHLPHTESHWLYTLGLFASSFSLLAYKIDSVSIFQIYIIVSCIIMLVIINRKKLGIESTSAS